MSVTRYAAINGSFTETCRENKMKERSDIMSMTAVALTSGTSGLEPRKTSSNLQTSVHGIDESVEAPWLVSVSDYLETRAASFP